MELVAFCHSLDFKMLKVLTKANPSFLLRAQAAFCHAGPTLAGEELQAPTSGCPTVPSYPIFHFAWWLLHGSILLGRAHSPHCCCSAPPRTGAPGEPIPFGPVFHSQVAQQGEGTEGTSIGIGKLQFPPSHAEPLSWFCRKHSARGPWLLLGDDVWTGEFSKSWELWLKGACDRVGKACHLRDIILGCGSRFHFLEKKFE